MNPRNDMPVLMWFRRDLRLAHQPALAAAAASGAPVLPVFVLDDSLFPGGASRWWLARSLKALHRQLRTGLLLLAGKTEDVLPRLLAKTGATAIYASTVADPEFRALDRRLAAHLPLVVVPDGRLFEARDLRRDHDRPWRVFTPFARAMASRRVPEPQETLTPLWHPATQEARLAAGAPSPDWHHEASWATSFQGQPGELAAGQRLSAFLNLELPEYSQRRDRPDVATSRLGAALHFGELSVRQVWWQAEHIAFADATCAEAVRAFQRQLLWREFALQLLDARPDMGHTPLDPRFTAFPWQERPDWLRAWQGGETGYPIVDAAMRCLWHTGNLANRLRMVVASFLAKDLLVPWQQGHAWFMDTLLDADLANNSFGWQWTAGCGADAAPFFRVFNPVLQGQRFDADGAFVRRWCPQLSALPSRWLHAPWLAPAGALRTAGIHLGENWPAPLVDHAAQRRLALAAYNQLRSPTLSSASEPD